MLLTGSCHCGNIAFTLKWESDPTAIPARACTCSFCTKHGAVWTSCPSGSLKVSLKDPALVSAYTFATKSAEFHVCTRCGVIPVVTSRISDHLYAVVNVNTLDGVDSALLQHTSTSFGEETEETRLARRQRNWIAAVDFSSGE